MERFLVIYSVNRLYFEIFIYRDKKTNSTVSRINGEDYMNYRKVRRLLRFKTKFY